MAKRPVVLPISTADDLLLFAHAINKLHNERQRDLLVTLTDDIDLTGVDWAPIGNENIPFYGTFDGAGHTISGLHIDEKPGACCGLFGVCVGIIENLTVTGTISCLPGTPHSAADGIVGRLAGGRIHCCTADFTLGHNRHAPGTFPDDTAALAGDNTVRNLEMGAAAWKEDTKCENEY